MKRLVIASLMVLGTTVSAQTINLACQGSVNYSTTSKKYPSLNEKNKKDWILFNVIVEPATNSLTIGDSFYTANVKYTTLSVSDSHYRMYYLWNNPSPEYNYHSTLIFINRFDGQYKLSSSSLSKDGLSKTELESHGTCQIGVHWQQKF